MAMHPANQPMSEYQLKAFLEAVKADTDLQEKLKLAGTDADAVLAVAKDAGFIITAEVLEMHQYELSDEDLENVAGGRECAWEYASYQFNPKINRLEPG